MAPRFIDVGSARCAVATIAARGCPLQRVRPPDIALRIYMCRLGTITRAGATLILALWLAACDVDLFGNDRQPLVGPFGVFVAERGKHYLVLDHFESGCGLLGDAIHQIGWNERLILVQLEPCTGEGPPSGWRVVNVQTKTIEPITEERIKTRPDLAGLKLVTAHEAWSRGRWWLK